MEFDAIPSWTLREYPGDLIPSERAQTRLIQFQKLEASSDRGSNLGLGKDFRAQQP
jgi:hypothetical protein